MEQFSKCLAQTLLKFLTLHIFCLEKSAVWVKTNKLTLNVKKTKFMVFSENTSQITNNYLKIGDTNIEQIGTNCNEKYFKFVGTR